MNKSTLSVIFVILAIVAFSIYWFGVRPTLVRSDCWESSKLRAGEIVSNEAMLIERGQDIKKRVDYLDMREEVMRNCLLEHGLAK